MYIRILNYLINNLTNLRDKVRKPVHKGMTVQEWAKKQRSKQKSYK